MEKPKVSGFQFKNPRLTKLVFETNTEFVSQNQELEVGFSMENTVKRRDEEAIVSFTLSVFKDQKQVAPFFIEATIEALFVWSADDFSDDKMVQDLLSINAPSLLLSYLRPHISQVTAAAGFPPLNVPFFDFTKKQK